MPEDSEAGSIGDLVRDHRDAVLFGRLDDLADGLLALGLREEVLGKPLVQLDEADVEVLMPVGASASPVSRLRSQYSSVLTLSSTWQCSACEPVSGASTPPAASVRPDPVGPTA